MAADDEYRGAMFGTTRKASPRNHDFTVERDVKIPMSDGVRLGCGRRRPGAPRRFPAVLGFRC